ncbi:MAG: DUF3887 domain-containing protein [Methanophagales archaeon]|nr:DUF3887 domain-containing protein [Methanophagales archaeon]
MKKGRLIIILVLTLSLIFTVGRTKTTVTPVMKNVESTAKHFVGLLSKGQFDEANKMLAEIMVESLKEQNLTLEEIWSDVIAQTGKFREIKETKVTEEMGYNAFYVTCDFEEVSLNVKVILDKEGKVAGLFFLPAQSSEVIDLQNMRILAYSRKENV